MGLSIYLFLPIIAKKNFGLSETKFLNVVATGIFIFLVSDVFLNAVQIMYNGNLDGYGIKSVYYIVFISFTVIGFIMLFIIGHRASGSFSIVKLSLIIALGIAFQNLTKGLLFGSVSSIIGLDDITLVILLGFILQNFTERFPIVSPFLGSM